MSKSNDATPNHLEDALCSYGFHEDKNSRYRRKMEDSHKFIYDFGGIKHQIFAAIFDGHAGKGAADWCGNHFHEVLLDTLKELPDLNYSEILNEAFLSVDNHLIRENGISSGCTAAVCLISEINGTRKLFAANVGDARAVLDRGGKALCLTYDHKGSDPFETSRVIAAGGFVANDRVNGVLAISRALGDEDLKDVISGKPFTTEVDISSDDHALVIACDGLWDVCSNQKAIELITDIKNSQEAAECLVKYALENGSMDNLSVMVLKFQSVQ